MDGSSRDPMTAVGCTRKEGKSDRGMEWLRLGGLEWGKVLEERTQSKNVES